MKLKDLVELKAGSPQSRIKEQDSQDAKTYFFYTTECLNDDLYGINHTVDKGTTKFVRTADDVETANEDEVVVSLISPKAAKVRKCHDGFLLTQNFVKLTLKEVIDANYLIYLLNEDRSVRKQMFESEGPVAMKKTTIKRLENIVIPHLPDMETQASIGNVYMKQMRLTYLRKMESQLKEQFVLESIKRVG